MTLVRDGHDVSGATAARPANAQIGQQFYDTTVGCLLVFDGTNWVPCGGARDPIVLVGATPHAVTAADHGKIFLTTIADVVFTLVATAAGLRYTFVNGVASGGTGLSVSPVAADKINAQADDKDIINSGASDVVGDSVTIVGDGTDGWKTIAKIGTWASE